MQRPRRAQETKNSVETKRTLDKASNCRPQIHKSKHLWRSPDHREKHKHTRQRRETTTQRENTQSARAGGCDSTRMRPSAMPPQRLLRKTPTLRDTDTKKRLTGTLLHATGMRGSRVASPKDCKLRLTQIPGPNCTHGRSTTVQHHITWMYTTGITL